MATHQATGYGAKELQDGDLAGLVANKAQEKLYATLKRDGSTKAMLPQMQTRVELYDTIGLAGYEALDASIVATIVPQPV